MPEKNCSDKCAGHELASDAGGPDAFQDLIRIKQDVEMRGGPPSGSLSERILASTAERFESYGHYPSPEHWDGLRAIAAVIEGMAFEKAEPLFFYSSLPAGMGKTSIVQEAVRTLVADTELQEIGVIVLLNQLDLIPVMIEEIGLEREQFAVETGKDNKELNESGRGTYTKTGNWKSEHGEAQILFTTQQKLHHMLYHQKDFAKVFKYRGQPRQIRIWDESILPAEPVTLSDGQISAFIETLAQHGQVTAADKLQAWWKSIDTDVTTVPMFIFDVQWNFLEAHEETLFAHGTEGGHLSNMQGREVRVHQDQHSGATTISYREALPLNFPPVLVLDASGQLRVTYRAWSEGRGGLVELPSPGKTYHNLTIRHWDHAAGKAAYRSKKKLEALAEATSKAIEQIPADEQVLVITRLCEKPYANIEQRVVARIQGNGGDPSRLRFLTWGRHTATNAFADVRHVIVVGLLQYSRPQNEAALRAAAKMSVEEIATEESVEALRIGEIAHHLFQAVGRGAVRRCVDGDVPPGCTLWAIFSTHGHMRIPRELLSLVFPGAEIESWLPFGVELNGGGLKTENRHRFVQALIELIGDAKALTFDRRDLTSEFSPQMVHRYLNEDIVVQALSEAGFVLTLEKQKHGRAWRSFYTLTRRT